MSDKISAHYISGTHWDREWYRPFEEFRFLLVSLMDSLLELMEGNNAFEYFQLDGQTCVLEDYLEIRPENRERLAKLIREQRILIGPWFTMPDLFCPDGESLVRNLLVGHRICKDWGVDPMPVGFTCDMFGHPSQMPQIFAGFGIRDIVLGRGTNESTTDMFFNWKAADGTGALVFKLEDTIGYGAFAKPRRILEDNGQALHATSNASIENGETDIGTRERRFREELAKYIDHESDRANLPLVAVMDSMDHMPPAENVERYLRLIREACPNTEPRHSTLPKFFAEARQKITMAGSLQEIQRELREPSRNDCGYLYLIPNCVSSRVRLKQSGDAAASLLRDWADPLLALGMIEHEDVVQLKPFTDKAWKYVLLNHAHDSVCGCSIDQVHRDMMHRFDQARILAEQTRNQVFSRLTAECSSLARNDDEFTITLFNPTPIERHETVVFDVDFPLDYSTQFKEGFRTQELKSFTLETADGEVVEYQRLNYQPVLAERSRVARYCFVGDGLLTRYTVAATLDLPGFGFTMLRVKPCSRPVRPVGTLRTGPTAAANEFLAVSVNANGTLELVDKVSGEVYRDLLAFEDRSEIGDGWFHGHSLNDKAILSSGARARIAVVHDGPEMITFEICLTLDLPQRYDWPREAPDIDTTVAVTIVSAVSLRRSARVLDVVTTVDNLAEDHRLQLLLPSDAAAAKTYWAQTSFDVVERAIRLDPETRDWQEMDIVEKPFESVQAVGDGQRGLAFLSGGGLHEGGVRDDQRRTLQVTMLRSFRRTVGTEGERDGLEQGKIVCRYALMPYCGEFPAAAAVEKARRLQAGLLTRQSGRLSSGFQPMTGDAPSTRSYLTQVDGDVILSTIKAGEHADDHMVLRLWNPTEKVQTSHLVLGMPVESARLLRLDETPLEKQEPPMTLDVEGQTLNVVLPAKKICTLGVALRKSSASPAVAT